MARRANKRELRQRWDPATGNADDLELQALREGGAAFPVGLLDEVTAETITDDFPPPVPLPMAPRSQDGEFEDLISSAVEDDALADQVEVVRQRKRVLGAQYPFAVSGGSLVYEPKTARSHMSSASR